MKTQRFQICAAIASVCCMFVGCGDEADKPSCPENQVYNDETGACEVPIGVKTCESDSDCRGGKVCRDHSCVAKPECENDADCGAGKVCNANHCEVKLECITDDDCGAGKVCNANHCEVKPECVTDDDCGAGKACNANHCEEKPECVTDGDCGENKVCNANHCEVKYQCVEDEDCGENRVCIANICEVKVECVVDDDCGAGKVCNANQCEEKPECVTDDDCGEGKFCEQDKCLAIECTQSKDCKPGFVCIDRLCEEDPLKCTFDTDCETGFFCIDDICKDPNHECDTREDCGGSLKCTADHKCVPECETEADCTNNYICSMNQCKPQCMSNSDCKNPAWCQNNRCTTACTSSDECPGSNICKGGKCSPECTTSADCTGSLFCNENRCVECVTDDHCDSKQVCRGNLCTESTTLRYPCLITDGGGKVYQTDEGYTLPKNTDGSISLCSIGYKPSKAEIEAGASEACVPLYKARSWDILGDGIDSNCDGYDYDLSSAVFVAATGQGTGEGNDDHTGKYNATDDVIYPVASIQAAFKHLPVTLVENGKTFTVYPDILVSKEAAAALSKAIEIPAVSADGVSSLTQFEKLVDDMSLTTYAYHQKLAQKSSESAELAMYGWLKEGDVPKAGVRIYGGMTQSKTNGKLWTLNEGDVTKQNMTITSPLSAYHMMVKPQDKNQSMSLAMSHFDMQFKTSGRSPLNGTTLVGLTCGIAGCRELLLNDVEISVFAPDGQDRGGAGAVGANGNNGKVAQYGIGSIEDATSTIRCTTDQMCGSARSGLGGCGGYATADAKSTHTEYDGEPVGKAGVDGSSQYVEAELVAQGGKGGAGLTTAGFTTSGGCGGNADVDNLKGSGGNGANGANGRNGSKAGLTWSMMPASDGSTLYWASNYDKLSTIDGANGAGGGGGGGGAVYHLYTYFTEKDSWVSAGSGGNGGCGGTGGMAGGTGGSAIGLMLASTSSGTSRIELNNTKVMVKAGSGGLAQSGSNGGKGGKGGAGVGNAKEGLLDKDLQCQKATSGGNGGNGGGGGAGAGGMAGVATAFVMACTRNATNDCSAETSSKPCFTSNDRFSLANCGFDLPLTFVARFDDSEFASIEAGYSVDDAAKAADGMGAAAGTGKTKGDSSFLTTWIGTFK